MVIVVIIAALAALGIFSFFLSFRRMWVCYRQRDRRKNEAECTRSRRRAESKQAEWNDTVGAGRAPSSFVNNTRQHQTRFHSPC